MQKRIAWLWLVPLVGAGGLGCNLIIGGEEGVLTSGSGGNGAGSDGGAPPGGSPPNGGAGATGGGGEGATGGGPECEGSGPSTCAAVAECRQNLCVGGACVESQAPSGTPCDGGVCTADEQCVECLVSDHCDAGEVCAADTNLCVPDSCPACDDGLFCNGADTCDGNGDCTIHEGDPCAGSTECSDSCNEAADNCFDSAGTACGNATDDACTDPDTCNGSGNCVANNEAPGTACNDGMFCNGADACNNAGVCGNHSGDPCAGGAQCMNQCNEAGDNCLSPSGTACGSNVNNDCTNPDTCNGGGSCLPNHEVSGTGCGSSANTDCSNPDTCNGSGTCLPNNEPAGIACGSGTNTACTNPDTCNGSGTCNANHEPNGTNCAPPLGGQCIVGICESQS